MNKIFCPRDFIIDLYVPLNGRHGMNLGRRFSSGTDARSIESKTAAEMGHHFIKVSTLNVRGKEMHLKQKWTCGNWYKTYWHISFFFLKQNCLYIEWRAGRGRWAINRLLLCLQLADWKQWLAGGNKNKCSLSGRAGSSWILDGTMRFSQKFNERKGQGRGCWRGVKTRRPGGDERVGAVSVLAPSSSRGKRSREMTISSCALLSLLLLSTTRRKNFQESNRSPDWFDPKRLTFLFFRDYRLWRHWVETRIESRRCYQT